MITECSKLHRIKLTSDHKLHEGKKDGHRGHHHIPGVPPDKGSVYVLLKRMTNSQVIPTLGRKVETGGQEFFTSFSYVKPWRETGKLGWGRKRGEGK